MAECSIRFVGPVWCIHLIVLWWRVVQLWPSVNLNFCFEKYYDQRVCLSVCFVFFVLLHISKTACPNFAQFSVHIRCGCGLVLVWRQCEYSYNAGNRLEESKTTHMFRPVRQVAAPVARARWLNLVGKTTHSCGKIQFLSFLLRP